jgi:branched-chain amino acid aminotransferase
LRRTPPDSLSPRAKMHQYLNLVLADREVKAQNPQAWAVLLDVNGNLAEGQGSNIFLVRDGVLVTPRERYVLPGVSRQAVIDLAGRLGIRFEESDLDLYDAYTADECFLTSTSLCICAVRTLNGRSFGEGVVPGPVTRRFTEAYKELVDCDFVAQYLQYLDA